MDRDTVEYYIKKLNQVKKRVIAYRNIRKNRESLSIEILVEIEALQIKRILEDIAFCFTLAIGDKAIPTYINFTKFKNIREYISRLNDFHIKFYPYPLALVVRENDTVWWGDAPSDEYITIDEFQSLYENCISIISPYIIGSPKIDFDNWENASSTWIERISCLLNHHAIKVQKSSNAMIFSMNGENDSAGVGAYLYVDENEIVHTDSDEKSESDIVSLFDHLTRQIKFLRRSCEIYDTGNFDEAIRLAVTIRTLIHDTPKSVSLLNQLKINNTIEIPTSFGHAKKLPENFQAVSILPIFATSSAAGSSSPFPLPEPAVTLPLEEWWNEIVWMQGVSLTRKQIILYAANKEGGAHVEEKPNKAIEELRKGLTQIVSMKINGIEVGSPANYHFILLRQFAHELLNCNSLLDLANPLKNR